MTKTGDVRRIKKTAKKLQPKVSKKFIKTLADSLETFEKRRQTKKERPRSKKVK